MLKNIYRNDGHYVRLNGNTLEWSNVPYGNWKFKKSTWLPYEISSPKDVLDIIEMGDDELIAFTTKGIFYTNNGCMDWKFVVSRWDHDKVDLDSIQVYGDEMVSITPHGVFSSKDRGLSWHPKRNY